MADQLISEAVSGTPVELPVASGESGQGDERQAARAETTAKDRLLEIVEVCLVVLVAFGHSLFHSLYPLFMGATDGLAFRSDSRFCWPFELGAGTVLLAYVLSPLGLVGLSPKSAGREGGTTDPLPSRLLGRTGCWLRPRATAAILVVLIVFGPWALNWLFSWVPDYGYSFALRGNIRHLSGIFDDLLTLGVLGYILRRRGRSFSDIGLDWKPRAIALVLPLFLLAILLNVIQWPLTRWVGETISQPDWEAPDISRRLFGLRLEVAAVPSCLVNGFFEELIVRAYLMTAVMKLTRRTWVAVVVSVAVQTSYHFYQGVPVALSHIPLFAGYAIFFAKTRSILPIALAHALVDLHSLWGYGLRLGLP